MDKLLRFGIFLGYLLLLKDATTSGAIGLSLFYFCSVLREHLRKG